MSWPLRNWSFGARQIPVSLKRRAFYPAFRELYVLAKRTELRLRDFIDPDARHVRIALRHPLRVLETFGVHHDDAGYRRRSRGKGLAPFLDISRPLIRPYCSTILFFMDWNQRFHACMISGVGFSNP